MEENAESIPELSEADIEQAEALVGTWSPSEEDEPRVCTECGSESVFHHDDLEWEETRGHTLIVLRRLSGEKCRSCEATWFAPESFDLIQRHRQVGPGANYEAKVSRVGGSSLGIYLPKNLQRVMGIEAGDKVYLTPASDDAVIMELRRAPRGDDQDEPGTSVDEALGM